MLRDAREEARNILEEAKEVADESIRKYHAWGQHPKQNNMKKMEAQRSDLSLTKSSPIRQRSLPLSPILLTSK